MGNVQILLDEDKDKIKYSVYVKFWFLLFVFVSSTTPTTKKTIYCSFYRTRVRSLALLVTHWLTDCRLVNLVDATLVCKDANSILVEVVTVADVDDEHRVGNSLLQIWSWRLVIKLNFCSDFEHKGWSRFWSWSSARFWNWSLLSILPLMFCRGDEVESWSMFWS